MQTRQVKFISSLFCLCFLLIWIIFTIKEGYYYGRVHWLKELGNFLGAAGYLFLSISLFLASRWSKLEDWMGGLDQIYRAHHQFGIWGCLFTFIHPLVLAIRWLPQHVDRFLLYIFPMHGRLSIDLGSLSLLLMLILIAVTSFKLLPYDKWKITHKFMSLAFILATLHILLLERRFSSSSVSYLLLFIPMGLGFFGIIYKQIISDYLIKYPLFEVSKTQILSDNLIEVFIKPKAESLFFIPGQYVFCRFESEQLTRESHPFTLCGSPAGPVLSILVKARGDFTRSLYHCVKPGDCVQLEGPYGRFDYTQAGPAQIWIAGGIGIAPFLAWARLFDQNPGRINEIYLFYCIHRQADAAFAEEFQRISRRFPYFHFFLFCSEQDCRLDVEKVRQLAKGLSGKKILMCGPKRLTQNFTEQFQRMGVKEADIYFEDFEFF